MLIEPILLYGSETWTPTMRQQQWLDGEYTDPLQRPQNIHWSEHATCECIYSNLPPPSQNLAKQRLQFTCHCQRAVGEIVQSILLWKPSEPVNSRRLTFPYVIARDSGIDRSDQGNAWVLVNITILTLNNQIKIRYPYNIHYLKFQRPTSFQPVPDSQQPA